MARGIKRLIRKAQNKVDKEISDLSQGFSHFAGGMASEGYAGGYRDALSDVLLALNGEKPQRRNYWD